MRRVLVMLLCGAVAVPSMLAVSGTDVAAACDCTTLVARVEAVTGELATVQAALEEAVAAQVPLDAAATAAETALATLETLLTAKIRVLEVEELLLDGLIEDRRVVIEDLAEYAAMKAGALAEMEVIKAQRQDLIGTIGQAVTIVKDYLSGVNGPLAKWARQVMKNLMADIVIDATMKAVERDLRSAIRRGDWVEARRLYAAYEIDVGNEVLDVVAAAGTLTALATAFSGLGGTVGLVLGGIAGFRSIMQGLALEVVLDSIEAAAAWGRGVPSEERKDDLQQQRKDLNKEINAKTRFLDGVRAELVTLREQVSTASATLRDTTALKAAGTARIAAATTARDAKRTELDDAAAALAECQRSEGPSCTPDPDPHNEPPPDRRGDGRGDPHYTTIDGLYFDVQSEGEYVLAASPDGFEVQVSHVFYDDDETVAVISQVAVRTPAGDVVAWRLADAAPTLNGAALTGPQQLSAARFATIPFASAPSGVLILADGSRVEVHARGRYFDVRVDLGVGRAVRGLLGDGDGVAANDISSRDGAVVLDPATIADAAFNAFYADVVTTWQPTTRLLGGDVVPFSPPSGPPFYARTDIAAALELCAAAGVTGETFLAECATDVAATGDESFAVADRFTADEPDVSAGNAPSFETLGAAPAPLDGELYVVGLEPVLFQAFVPAGQVMVATMSRTGQHANLYNGCSNMAALEIIAPAQPTRSGAGSCLIVSDVSDTDSTIVFSATKANASFFSEFPYLSVGVVAPTVLADGQAYAGTIEADGFDVVTLAPTPPGARVVWDVGQWGTCLTTQPQYFMLKATDGDETGRLYCGSAPALVDGAALVLGNTGASPKTYTATPHAAVAHLVPGVNGVRFSEPGDSVDMTVALAAGATATFELDECPSENGAVLPYSNLASPIAVLTVDPRLHVDDPVRPPRVGYMYNLIDLDDAVQVACGPVSFTAPTSGTYQFWFPGGAIYIEGRSIVATVNVTITGP